MTLNSSFNTPSYLEKYTPHILNWKISPEQNLTSKQRKSFKSILLIKDYPYIYYIDQRLLKMITRKSIKEIQRLI